MSAVQASAASMRLPPVSGQDGRLVERRFGLLGLFLAGLRYRRWIEHPFDIFLRGPPVRLPGTILEPISEVLISLLQSRHEHIGRQIHARHFLQDTLSRLLRHLRARAQLDDRIAQSRDGGLKVCQTLLPEFADQCELHTVVAAGERADELRLELVAQLSDLIGYGLCIRDRGLCRLARFQIGYPFANCASPRIVWQDTLSGLQRNEI